MSFWKKLFGEKKPDTEKVEFLEIANWLRMNSQISLGEEFGQIERTKKELHEKLDKLEKVDISGLKVEDRLKTMVLGNKPTYIKNVKLFIENINVPKTFKHEDLARFCDDFQKELLNFTKKTQRNYFIINNLIGPELTDVAQEIN